MELLERFTRAVRARHSNDQSAIGTPTPLAVVGAAVGVLPVAGAGITLIDPLMPLPLGASSPGVAVAERLQATLGVGPCLHAALTDTAIVADAAALELRWPVYHERLIRDTPFRSVAALPMRNDGDVFAALNLYGVGTVMTDLPDLDDIQTGVTDPTSALIAASVDDLTGLGAWDDNRVIAALGTDESASERFRRRLDVWTAVGMVMEAADVAGADALALLRGYAYSHDTDIDTLADHLIHRRVTTGQIVD